MDIINLKGFFIFPMLVLLFSCGKIQHKPVDSTRPNILLIYTDQQRYNTIRELGNNHIETPNLDNLLKTGVAFSNAFVTAPVCTPSRWSLHSGMYTSSHQTYSNHHIGKRPKTSLPLELKKIDYTTALIGKNHSFLDEKDMDIIYDTPKFKKMPEDGRSAAIPMPWKVEEDPMHLLTDSVINLLKSNEGKPTFVWLSYLHPHTPYALPEPYFSMYDRVEIPEPAVEPEGLKAAGKPFRQVFHQENNDRLIPYDRNKIMRMKRNYYGMISMVDDEIGRLLSYLEKEGLKENTLIIFTSDHGDYMGDHHMVTKSPAMYDCLIRVPLIFNWEKNFPKKMVTDHLVSHVDIMPTILALLGAEVPEQVQGKSFADFLKGGEISSAEREYVYAEYGIPGKPIDEKSLQMFIPDYQERPIYYNNPKIPWEANPISLTGRFRMIRNKEWKFVQEENGISELYNLQNDPDELVNLWQNPAYQAIQEQLESDLNLWKKNLPGIEKDTLNMGKENILAYLKKRKN
ncbi:sulfatase family protein [Flexithrix dorotheae]|uniref:sulfatase family protein n=1 Tax=Flexithrix dorotheae TaxID=70993 RepID=UPI00036DB4E9|nr:sulfatase-like hydrolase/transferase [Flexithrix dorotheae]